jgi:AhpD family alkylhydroperoxidase
MADVPRHYASLTERFPEVLEAVESLRSKALAAGGFDARTGHLLQLVAAAATRSEGAVHSHARQALAAGATPEQLYQALLLLVSTVGFPTVAAAISWVDDIVHPD